MKKIFLKAFPYSGLPSPVYVLFFSRIVNRMGDFVRFFLTLYLTAYLNMDEKAAGLIISLSALASIGGNLVGGKVTDFAGRKKIMLGGQFFTALCIGFCGFMPDAGAVPVLLIISQFFSGAVRPVSGSMVIDLTKADQRAKAMSLLYLGINIGVAVGPLIAGFLFHSHRRWIFWGDAATTAAAILLVALFVPETMPSKEEHAAASGGECGVEGSIWKALAGRPVLFVFMLSSVLIAFIYDQNSFTLPLQLQHFLGAESARVFGWLMSVNAVTVLVLTPVILKLLGQSDPLRNLRFGSLCYTIGFGMLFFIRDSFAMYLVSTVIWTAGEIIMVTNEGVFIASHTPVTHRGRINGFRNMFHGLGGMITPAISGVFISTLGIKPVWLLVFGLTIVYLFILVALKSADSRG